MKSAKVVLLTLFIFLSISALANSKNDNNTYIPPNYYTMQPPAAGETYVDPVFRSEILRITDAVASGIPGIAPEYSTPSPANMDSSYFLLSNQIVGGMGLYDGSGNYLRSVTRFDSDEEPRWSRIYPDILYYHLGREIWEYNARTNLHKRLRVFSSSISFGQGESDLSDNDRTTIIFGNGQVFIYDIKNDVTYPAVTAQRSFDSAGISPDGDYFVISYNGYGQDRYQGVELYDINGKFVRQLTNAISHSDFARDVDGSQIWVQSNAPTDPQQPPPPADNAVIKVSIPDGQITAIFVRKWFRNLDVHISGSAGDGWVYLSLFDPADPNPAVQWDTWYMELLRVRADGSVIERLAHHRSRASSYEKEPHASISIDGTRLFYASDFHLPGAGASSSYVDTYMLLVSRSLRVFTADEDTRGPRSGSHHDMNGSILVQH